MQCASNIRDPITYLPSEYGPLAEWSNWTGNVRVRTNHYKEPSSVEEVQEIIREAISSDRKVRAVGAGHSWNPSMAVSSESDVLISTARLNKIIRFNMDRQQLTVEAGVTVGQTVDWYRSHGFCLPFQIDYPGVTIAGAISNGCSGFSTRHAGYSDAVCSVEFVDGKGNIVTINKDTKTNPDIWKAVFCSQGLMGVVTKITLQLEEQSNIRVVNQKVKLKEALKNIEHEVARNTQLQYQWIATTDSVLVHRANPTKEPITPGAARIAAGVASALEKLTPLYERDAESASAHTPSLLSAAAKLLPASVEYVIPACDDLFFTSAFETAQPFVDIGCHIATQAGDMGTVKLAWKIATDLVKQYAESGRYPVNFTMALRVMPCSNTLLNSIPGFTGSQASARNAHIQMLSFRKDALWEQFSRELLEKWFNIPGTRVHWAKQYQQTDSGVYDKIRSAYGDHLTRFLAVRECFDPDKLFVNPFLSKVLNIEMKKSTADNRLSPLLSSLQPMVLPALDELMSKPPPVPFLSAAVTKAEKRAPDLIYRFLLWFAWLVYRIAWRLGLCEAPKFNRQIALYTQVGVPSSLPPQYIDFFTDDGLRCQLVLWQRKPTKQVSLTVQSQESQDVVVIMHGLTTSTDMFIMPEHVGFVEGLLQQGFNDVFTVDNRISKRWHYNLECHSYTLDHLAAYDNPAMLRAINQWSERTHGHRKGIHVIAHCVNSMSISMTAAAGLITHDMQVRSIICNSTSLTPHVGFWARLKMMMAPNLSNAVFEYLSLSFIREPMISLRRIAGHLVSLFHWECESPECHLVSFIWSFGFPGVWRHQQLLEISHARAGDLYGATSMRYDMHIRKCLLAGRLMKWRKDSQWFPQLPNDYLQSALEGNLNTPLLLITGAENGVFYDSNQRLKKKLDDMKQQNRNFIRTPVELRIFDNYGHQDVYMGANVAKDILPTCVNFMHQFSTPAETKVGITNPAPPMKSATV